MNITGWDIRGEGGVEENEKCATILQKEQEEEHSTLSRYLIFKRK